MRRSCLGLLFAPFLFLCFTSPALGQEIDAFAWYTSDGTSTTFGEVSKASTAADVVFFGELHNNPISHWLQLKLAQELHGKHKKKLVIGAEMFEADNQLLLDEYLSGAISESSFKTEARLWPNYATDYAPLVEFAKSNELKFVATNIPRRYASAVFKKGIESLNELSDEAKSYIAPLPIAIDLKLSCYASMMEMAEGHGGENFPKAQAVKDATMAHFIDQNFPKNGCFYHVNGAYHSDNHESIVWYVTSSHPEWKLITISTVSQKDVHALEKEYLGKADYILVVDETMTATH